MTGLSPEEQAQPLLLTINQVATLLGVSRSAVYALMHQQGLPSLHLGVSLRFSQDSLRAWIQKQEEKERETSEALEMKYALRDDRRAATHANPAKEEARRTTSRRKRATK